MSIPLATTTVTIKGRRPQQAIDPDAEGYDPAPDPPVILATGVRAVISLPQLTRNNADADEIDLYHLRCDPVPVQPNRFDTVVDEVTGVEYQVLSATHSDTEIFGLEHTIAKLYLTKGLTSERGPDNVTTRV